MPDYKDIYFGLAGKVADAIDILERALLRAEAEYIDGENEPLLQINEKSTDNKGHKKSEGH